MKQIQDTYKKTGQLHHAYGILGNREKVKEELFAFLEKDLKFPVIGNPDFWHREFNVFKIDDGREMSLIHLNKSIKFDRKIFIVTANSITRDAQNSLLKIFEEPNVSTTFFLIMPDDSKLLPTLKSRLIIVNGKKDTNLMFSTETFLKAKVGKRLEIIAKILKDIKDEKMTKAEAITFIKNLEMNVKSNDQKRNLLVIEDLEKAISYASDESPSIKVILEHLALVL